MCRVFFKPFLFAFFILSGCGGNPGKNNAPQDKKNVVQKDATEVKTVVIRPASFNRELISNGKIISADRADLRFAIQDVIKELYVSEGQLVKKGQLIAKLDDTEIKNTLVQAELENEKAKLDYEDHLLRMGYRLSDTAHLDLNIKKMARLRSGLSFSEVNLSKIKRQIELTTLIAPFDGKIANLKAKCYNNSASFDFICTIVDNSSLIVEFKILEEELHFIKNSSQVLISPFGSKDDIYTGRMGSINPLVDNSGMITVKANVKNDGHLLDGMGVNVKITQIISDQIVVPKEAVLDRQNRKVVFTMGKENLAQWNYVEIDEENSSQFSLKSGLKLGDEVIYKGNFNLAQDTKVVRAN